MIFFITTFLQMSVTELSFPWLHITKENKLGKEEVKDEQMTDDRCEQYFS